MLKDMLLQLREKHDYSYTKVATGIGVRTDRYKKYESGETEPTVKILCRIADFYDVTTDYLLEMDKAREEYNKNKQKE